MGLIEKPGYFLYKIYKEVKHMAKANQTSRMIQKPSRQCPVAQQLVCSQSQLLQDKSAQQLLFQQPMEPV
jgi:hypothetical protein